MYKSQIRKMVGDMTEQQLILLWNMFLEDTKYNTVHIHRLSNSIVSQVYRLPVVHKNQLSDNHILNLLHFLVRDGLLRDFSISKGDVVEIEVETNYYLLPDILVNRLNLINRGQSYLHRLLYKKDLVTGESYIVDDSLQMDVKIGLGEAFINVLDNAVKYSPGGSKIFIRLQKRNDLVRMEIEDQGIGIPQNEYHKIFQRFYRGSSKEVMEKSGTGIGLFLSREIIEKHAGTITVTSGKKKKGSTFVIQLPYVG